MYSTLPNVLVEVSGERFTLVGLDYADSITITNFMSYRLDDSEPVHINVPLDYWHNYLYFLDSNYNQNNVVSHNTSKTKQQGINVGALYVIDYLDNVQQFKLWYDDCCNNNIKFTDIVRAVSKTSFTMISADKFFGIQNVGQLLLSLNDIPTPSNILANHISHTILTLFNSNTLDVYHEICQYSKLRSVSSNLLVKLKNHKFILTDYDGVPILNYNKWEFSQLSGNTFCIDELQPHIISPRIAPKYKNLSDTNIYAVNNNGNNCYVVCHGKHQYLDRYLNYDDDYNSNSYEYYCSKTYQGINPVVFTEDANIVTPQFKSDVKINDYRVYTYNNILSNSDYYTNRDYCLYLVYEVDPISRSLYALNL